ncbi:MAG: nitroreductase family protein [Oscillospiraceae bacterium]|jgi:nitroreductase|nr:nitroreductase family protein [Oscillospiraceae bacterium]
MINNDVFDSIRARRSTRAFSGRAVEADKLDALLEAAIWAPSGGNNQTWLFTAIQNGDVLARLDELAREAFLRYVPDDDYPGKHGAKAMAEKSGDFHCFHRAPTLIIASNRPGYENAMADCALALENIFIAAESIGLGSCYINAFHWLRDDRPLREYMLAELGIPREHTICSAAAVGYIGKPSAVPERKPGTIRIIR